MRCQTAITLSTVNRFWKFFHRWNLETAIIIYFSPPLKNLTALPCETYKF